MPLGSFALKAEVAAVLLTQVSLWLEVWVECSSWMMQYGPVAKAVKDTHHHNAGLALALLGLVKDGPRRSPGRPRLG